MNLKKVIKYSALGLVAVLATSALVACSSGKSASGKKTIEVGTDRKSTRLNSSHRSLSRMPSSA